MTNDLILLIDRLESEHVEVLDAVASLRPAIAGRDGAALQSALAASEQIFGKALNVHSETEDVDLFPQLAPLIGDEMVSMFVQEHVRIRALRDQVYRRMRQGEADFDSCGELCDLLGDHMDREDQVLFPSARGLLAD